MSLNADLPVKSLSGEFKALLASLEHDRVLAVPGFTVETEDTVSLELAELCLDGYIARCRVPCDFPILSYSGGGQADRSNTRSRHCINES